MIVSYVFMEIAYLQRENKTFTSSLWEECQHYIDAITSFFPSKLREAVGHFDNTPDDVLNMSIETSIGTRVEICREILLGTAETSIIIWRDILLATAKTIIGICREILMVTAETGIGICRGVLLVWCDIAEIYRTLISPPTSIKLEPLIKALWTDILYLLLFYVSIVVSLAWIIAVAIVLWGCWLG